MGRLGRVNLVLLAALVGASLYVWPSLPERIPRHFNAAGVPDAWSEKTVWSWFLLPAIATFTVLLLQVSAWAVTRRPALLNIPSKKQFLELPAEEQAPILAELRMLIQLVGTAMLAIFGIVQLATYRAALGHSVETLMVLVLVTSVAVGPALAIVIVVRATRRVSEAHRRATLKGTLRR